ncbi:leucine carboxyl methyltransferase [Hymenopellis radicata]|nr:leucine carboxyl methyltransferase [Hymenopellis radicata]
MFPPPSSDPDTPVRLTDNDAALARLSAVQKGYLTDPFVSAFVPRAHLQPPRPPLINIGTYVRTVAIDDLVAQWLALSREDGTQCQIVSLGAGSDSRFWRIAVCILINWEHNSHLAKYIEIDFPEITSKKAMTIRKSKPLGSVLGDPAKIQVSGGGTGLKSPRYNLIPADLRRPPQETLASILFEGLEPLLSSSRPTLLLFECVLAYMSPDSSNALLTWFRQQFSDGILGSVVYEMFGLEDSFGLVMVNNLKARQVDLPGAVPYPTQESLPTRFLDVGFTAADALSLRDIRLQYISHTENINVGVPRRGRGVEPRLQHYAITWGLSLPKSKHQSSWGTWGLKKQSSEVEED